MARSKLASKKLLSTRAFQSENISHPNGDVNALADFYEVSADQKERLFALQEGFDKLNSDCRWGMGFIEYSQGVAALAEKYNQDNLFSLLGMSPVTVVFNSNLKDQYKTEKQLAADREKTKPKKQEEVSSKLGSRRAGF